MDGYDQEVEPTARGRELRDGSRADGAGNGGWTRRRARAVPSSIAAPPAKSSS